MNYQSQAKSRSTLHQCEQMVDRKATLPDRVLRPPLVAAGFLDADLVLYWGWPLLRGLAGACGDRAVTAVALEPDPVDYFLARYNAYPVARVSVDVSETEYLNVLDSVPDPRGDSIRTASGEVAWLSDSGSWLVWADREYGLAVLAIVPGFRRQAGAVVSEVRMGGHQVRVLPPGEAVQSWVYEPDPGLAGVLEANYPEATARWHGRP